MDAVTFLSDRNGKKSIELMVVAFMNGKDVGESVTERAGRLVATAFRWNVTNMGMV